MRSIVRQPTAGFATLTVAVLLMLVGSFLFLESADAGYFMVKRYQNTLISTKNQWLAEGGLECGFVINKQNASVLPTAQDYSGCTDHVLSGTGDSSRLSLAVSAAGASSLYTLSSEGKEAVGRGKRKVERDIKASSASAMPGIFKTSSNFTLDGSFDLLPNKNTNASNENECITMVVKSKSNFVHSDSIDGSKLVVQDKNGYDDVSAVDGAHLNDKVGNFVCKKGYQSFHQVGQASDTYANDIVEESGMDMFKDMFGVTRDNWKNVRDTQFSGPGTKIINRGGANAMVTDCAAQISKAYSEGATKIWVDGSCYVDKASIKHGDPSAPFNFTHPNVNPKGQKVFLVVRDGIFFSPNGNFSFAGLLYQFNSGDRRKDGEGGILADMLTACKSGSQCNDSSQEKLFNNLAFYVGGSMYTYGGLAIDMEGMGFKIRGALVSAYDDTKWEGLIPSSVSSIAWRASTWRDL